MSDWRFTVTGVDATGHDFFGLWSGQPAPEASFGLAAAPDQAQWRVVLPADSAAAQTLLAERRAALNASLSALQEGARRLDGLQPAGPETVTSFAAGPAPPPAEQRLLDALAYLTDSPAATSFGLGLPRVPAGWQETVSDFRAFIERIGTVVQPRLRVDTVQGDRPVAFSLVSLTGHLQTVWAEEGAAALHDAALRLALDTRRLLLAFLARTAGGAAILAARFGVAGGPLLALPAAYRYLRDVVEGARALSL